MEVQGCPFPGVLNSLPGPIRLDCCGRACGSKHLDGIQAPVDPASL